MARKNKSIVIANIPDDLGQERRRALSSVPEVLTSRIMGFLAQ
jgi:hypothetical protein